MSDIYHVRSKFVWGVILLTVFLLAYGYLTTGRTPATTYNQQTQAQDQNQQFQNAISTSNIAECSDINGETQRQNCEIIVLSQNAFEQDDVSLCSSLPEIEERCVSEFNKKKAAQTGDETYCENNTNKDECYFNLAISSSDVSFCEKIGSETMRNNCISIVGG